jgi:predicted outer membrane repeat protein
MNRTSLIAVLAFFALAVVCGAEIINVPDDYETIQAGIDASRDGDTVLVQPGIYVENISIRRAITVASLALTTGDPAYIDSTIIDGNQQGTVVTISASMSLVGFTVQNGLSDVSGGGIYAYGDRFILDYLKITGNAAHYGGGLYVDAGGRDQCIVSRSVVNENEADTGGGIYSWGSVLLDSVVVTNNAAQTGGGIKGKEGLRCTRSRIINNQADDSGGGLILDGSYLEDVEIIGNCSETGGGAYVYDFGCKTRFHRVLFSENQATQFGGAICGGWATIDQVTIVGNESESGSAIYSDFNGPFLIANSIIAQAERDAIDWGTTITYSDVTNGQFAGEEGVINEDPRFVNPENGDFHLLSDSPCIDSGAPDSSLDPDGSRADMGALPYAKYTVVRGYVYDSLTDQPLAGVAVQTRQTPARYAVTDSTGFYIIPNARAEFEFSLVVSLNGYADSTVGGFRLSENDTLDWDFHLLRPLFTPSEDEVNREVAANDSVAIPLTLGNSGNYPLEWSVQRRLPDEPDAWSLARSYHIGQLVGNGWIEGVALIDERFYVAIKGEKANNIYILGLDGQLADIFVQPGEGRGMRDLAWDGEVLWGSGERNIYGITTDGQVVAVFEGPYRFNQALAWDTDRDLLWVCSVSSNEITGCNRNGDHIAELAQPGFRIYGLAYWSGDPDGYPLYIFHSPDRERQMVHKMNPDTGDTMFVHNLEPLEGGSPCGCEITGDYELFTQVFLSVANNGDDDRVDVWFLDADPTFLTFAPMEGAVDPGGSEEMSMMLSAVGLDTGRYDAELHFTFPEVRSETVIPVTMRVEPNSISDFGFWILDFGLGEAYPNPFNSSLAVSYQLSAVSRVSLKLYDVAGRLVSNQELGIRNAGSHRAVIDGSGLSSGVYFLKLVAGNRIATRKIVCVK